MRSRRHGPFEPSSAISRFSQRLAYLYRGLGPFGAVRRVVRKLLAPLYASEMAYVTLAHLAHERQDTPQGRLVDENGTECVLVESVEALESIQHEIPHGIPVARIRSHLRGAADSLAFLARRPLADEAGHHVVAYRLCRRGYFSAFRNGEIQGKISSDVMFVLHQAVLPEFRGQRIQRAMRRATHHYCRERGIGRTCGTIMAHNTPSLKAYYANRKVGGTRIVGSIRIGSALGGLYKWKTPWEEIIELLEAPVLEEQNG